MTKKSVNIALFGFDPPPSCPIWVMETKPPQTAFYQFSGHILEGKINATVIVSI